MPMFGQEAKGLKRRCPKLDENGCLLIERLYQCFLGESIACKR